MKLYSSAEGVMSILIDVINQGCQVETENNKVYCSDFALSAYEDCFSLLETEGLAVLMKRGKHKGLWLLKWDNNK
jgi:hypothetical protein